MGVLRALLLLLLVAVATADDAPQWTPVAADDASLLRSADSPPQLEELVLNATLSAAFSGCGLCQQTGQCDHAFRGQPGQFCIGLASGAPCCCPRDAQCAASPYDCRCRRVTPTYHYGGDDYHPNSHSGVSGTFIFFALLLFCCCCCYLPARRAQQAREEQQQFAYAQPVATAQYGTYPGQQQGPYSYATAPAVYESSPYHESSGGGNLAAGALGALGGLGVGAALGNMWGRSEGGGGGGYSGGSSAVDNTYTFSGDTGGGDYGGGDFGGDGGDDGTFAGDS